MSQLDDSTPTSMTLTGQILTATRVCLTQTNTSCLLRFNLDTKLNFGKPKHHLGKRFLRILRPTDRSETNRTFGKPGIPPRLAPEGFGNG